MKKGILLTVTVLSLAVSGITGCSPSETKETTGITAVTAETGDETEAATETAGATEAATEAAGETAGEGAVEEGYTPGTMTETGWESSWLNMKFTAGEGVTLLSEEERETILPSVKDGENVLVYEMMANSADASASVGIIVEKSELSPEAYMELMIEQLEEDGHGMTFSVEQEIRDSEFLGRPAKFMQIDSAYQGVEVNQHYTILLQDGYLIEVIGTGSPDSGEALAALMASFTTLE